MHGEPLTVEMLDAVVERAGQPADGSARKDGRGSMVDRVKLGSDRVAARLGVIVVVAVGLGAAGLTACSDEIPTDYTAANRDAFLAACSRPLDDPRLLSDICGCVYERIEDEVPFDEFQRINERLAGIPAPATGVAPDSGATGETVPFARGDLPRELVRLVADCITLEADL